MMQFAGVFGSEASLATFEMLEDVLLKNNSKRRKSEDGSGEGLAQSPFLSKIGSTAAESLASCSFCSFPTITESVAGNPIPD